MVLNLKHKIYLICIRFALLFSRRVGLGGGADVRWSRFFLKVDYEHSILTDFVPKNMIRGGGGGKHSLSPRGEVDHPSSSWIFPRINKIPESKSESVEVAAPSIFIAQARKWRNACALLFI